jgi:hypothetical protein
VRSLLYLACLALSAAAHAEIYRWTDAQGQAHFSERPESTDAQAIEVNPQVVVRDAATRESEARAARFFEARRDEQRQASAQAAERQAARSKECQRLRRALADIPQGYRFYRVDAQGERLYYSDEQVDSTRQQLSERIASSCT